MGPTSRRGDVPDDHEHPGQHPGCLRAWAVDDETGDWWAMCSYYVNTGMQLLGWVHQDHVTPVADLSDDDGLVGPARVASLPAGER